MTIRPISRPVRWSLLALVLLVCGCTNSKLIIGPLYNQLDDQIRKEFNKLARFNEQQKTAFEASLSAYHVWHRQSELPQYAALLKTIASSIRQQGTTQSSVANWIHQIEEHSMAARRCHPVNFSINLIKSLNDSQLDYIEARFRREQTKNRERYDSDTAEERVQRRLKKMQKWAGRLDLKFTQEQRSIVGSALRRQISLRTQYYDLTAKWNRDFFNLARNQSMPNYKQLMHSHFDRLWTLLESSHPQQWSANRELWQKTAFEFEQSLTDNQRIKFSRWISRLADTLISISRDEPDVKAGDDPSVGCLVAARQKPG